MPIPNLDFGNIPTIVWVIVIAIIAWKMFKKKDKSK